MMNGVLLVAIITGLCIVIPCVISTIAANNTKFPELFTNDEVANYGEVVTAPVEGQVFVRKDNKIYIFKPVASKHFNNEEYYYIKAEFK